MRVLISGASIAGPVLAYWLTRRGFEVTVVERAPHLRKTGGHAIDLFGPAMDIAEQMGVLDAGDGPRHRYRPHLLPPPRRPASGLYRLPQVVVRAVGPSRRDHARRSGARSSTGAGRDAVEYLFGDHITGIDARRRRDVRSTQAAAAVRSGDRRRRVALGVRQLVFGADSGHTEFLGAYLSVLYGAENAMPAKATRPDSSMSDPHRDRSIPPIISTMPGRCSSSYRCAHSTMTTAIPLTSQHQLRDRFAGMSYRGGPLRLDELQDAPRRSTSMPSPSCS